MIASVTTTEAEWSPLDYAEMQALDIYEASLCPGCKRPVDICAADFASQRAFMVDTHTCMAVLAREVQARVDAWEHADRQSRGDMPTEAKYSDGRMYIPRPATDDEASSD